MRHFLYGLAIQGVALSLFFGQGVQGIWKRTQVLKAGAHKGPLVLKHPTPDAFLSPKSCTRAMEIERGALLYFEEVENDIPLGPEQGNPYAIERHHGPD